MQPAIEIRDLEKTYSDGKRALKGVSFDVPRGQIFGLLGPNGAGKSTLINILAGLVNKTGGSARIWGFDIDEDRRNAKRAIGIVPQEILFDAFFTPFETLEIHAGLYAVPKAKRRTMEILRALRLEDKAHAYARTLSGGMKRRLLIGKALVHNPPILILDEPTAGVDIELRTMLWQNVRRLNAEGMTIILTTHYLEEAEEMCDEIAIVNHGRVVAQDSTANLLSRLDSKTLLIEPQAPAPPPPMPEGIAAETRPGGVLAFTWKSSRTSAEDVLEAVRAAGIRIRDVKTEQADLEDVFLDLTRSA